MSTSKVKPVVQSVFKSALEKKLGHPLRFDERKDILRVESGQSVSITETLRTGIVRSSAVVEPSNDIDDPSRIIGVVHDNFEAMDVSRAIRKYGKKAKPVPGLGQGVSQAPQAPQAPQDSSSPSA